MLLLESSSKKAQQKRSGLNLLLIEIIIHSADLFILDTVGTLSVKKEEIIPQVSRLTC